MYAIVDDRGSQFKVREGDLVRLPKLEAEVGATVQFNRVLLIDNGGGIKIGSPDVPNASVSGVVESHQLGEKVIAIRRIRTNKHVVRRGHRTQFTMVRIGKIQG